MLPRAPAGMRCQLPLRFPTRLSLRTTADLQIACYRFENSSYGSSNSRTTWPGRLFRHSQLIYSPFTSRSFMKQNGLDLLSQKIQPGIQHQSLRNPSGPRSPFTSRGNSADQLQNPWPPGAPAAAEVTDPNPLPFTSCTT